MTLRFQTGTRSTDTTVDANASVGNVRLESEATPSQGFQMDRLICKRDVSE